MHFSPRIHADEQSYIDVLSFFACVGALIAAILFITAVLYEAFSFLPPDLSGTGLILTQMQLLSAVI